jgi:hypothetical protein
MEKEANLVYKLQLHIKPGAKQSRITDVRPDCIDLQVHPLLMGLWLHTVHLSVHV